LDGVFIFRGHLGAEKWVQIVVMKRHHQLGKPQPSKAFINITIHHHENIFEIAGNNQQVSWQTCAIERAAPYSFVQTSLESASKTSGRHACAR
jgi:hypothetical protein